MFKIPPLWPFFYEFSESLPWPSLSFSEIRKTSREALQSALMGERRPWRLFAEGSFPNMIFFFKFAIFHFDVQVCCISETIAVQLVLGEAAGHGNLLLSARRVGGWICAKQGMDAS